jgi:hypothetical protein
MRLTKCNWASCAPPFSRKHISQNGGSKFFATHPLADCFIACENGSPIGEINVMLPVERASHVLFCDSKLYW